MLSSPPLPLPAEFPLRQLISLTNRKEQVGVWFRDAGPAHRLTLSADGRSVSLIIGEDLGGLLPICQRVVVRAGSLPIVVPVQALIRWRALQVIVSAAYLPEQERLRALFPGAEVESDRFRVPMEEASPEEVLARCVLHGIPVMESRVVYRPGGGAE